MNNNSNTCGHNTAPSHAETRFALLRFQQILLWAEPQRVCSGAIHKSSPPKEGGVRFSDAGGESEAKSDITGVIVCITDCRSVTGWSSAHTQNVPPAGLKKPLGVPQSRHIPRSRVKQEADVFGRTSLCYNALPTLLTMWRRLMPHNV